MARYRRLSDADRKAIRDALKRSEMDTAQAARMLYRRLKGLSAREVLAILREAVEEYAKQAAADVLAGVDRATRAGTAVAQQSLMATVLRNVPPGLAEKAAAWVERQASRGSYIVSPLTGARTAMVTADSRVWLSRRLHSINTTQVMRGLSRALADGIRHGETASQIAQTMRDQVGHHVAITAEGPAGYRIPPELTAVEAEVKAAIKSSGDPRAWARSSVRRDFRRYEETLARGELGTRAAAEHFLDQIDKAILKGSAEAVDRAVTWHAWNLEQRHQRLIARTETDRAFDEAYRSASDGIPWVVGLEWNLVGDYNCPVCSGYAQGHSAGMPPGCYTRAEFPRKPHPGCDCYATEITDASKEPQTDEEWEATLAA